MEYQVEQVISELSKIDNASESILTSADKEKEDYANEISLKTKSLDLELKADAQKYIENFKDKLQTDNEKILSQLRANTEKDLQKLDDAFNKNHTKMAKDIFARLIKE